MTSSKRVILIAGIVALLGATLIVIRHRRSVINTTSTKTDDRVIDSSKLPELSIQTGHSGSINCVAISPDSKNAVSGDDTGVAILWQVPSGIQIRRFVGHTSPILAIAFSSDGRYVVTGSGRFGAQNQESGAVDTTVRVWDVFSGAEIQRFEDNDKDVTSVQFSRDNAQVLTASANGKVKIFDIKSRKISQEFNPKSGLVNAARFSPDNAHVVTATGAPNKRTGHFGVQVWDTISDKPLRNIKYAAKQPIEYLAFSSDGKLLATAGSGRFLRSGENAEGIRLWDFETGRVKKFWPNLFGPISFSADNKYLVATTTLVGTVLVDLNSGDEVSLIRANQSGSVNRKTAYDEQPEEGETVAVDISRDARYIIVATVPVADGNRGLTHGDLSLRLFDTSTHREIREFKGNTKRVAEVYLSKDGDLVSAFNESPSIFYAFNPGGGAIWNTATGSVVQLSFSRTDQSAKLLAVSDDGKLAVTTSEEEARVWDIATQSVKWKFPSIEAAWFSTDHSRLLTWHALSGDDLPPTSLYENGYYPYNTAVTLWDTQNGKKLWRTLYDWTAPDIATESWLGSSPIEFGCALSPNGRYVVVGPDTGYALHDLNTGREKTLGLPEKAMVTFSPDSQYLIASTSGSKGYEIVLFDAASGKEKWSRPGVPDYVQFSSDAKYIVLTTTVARTEQWGTVLQVVEVKTGKEYWRLEDQSIKAFTFSQTGENLITIDQKGFTISVWNLQTKSLLKIHPGVPGTALLTLALSKDEKRIFAGGSDGQVHLLNLDQDKELCSLITFPDGTWVAVAPDGRFDTNNLEEIDGLHWIFPDDPLNPLPVEIFAREYYEPHLLSEVLEQKQSNPRPSLSSLNRTQPKVHISAIGTPDENGRVQVTVSAENQVSNSQRDRDGKLLESGVYDVRLFRDEHLVGSTTSLKQSSGATNAAGSQTLDRWREINALTLQDGKYEHSFTVTLPQNSDVKGVEFSAYAFNSDRVKSATERVRFPLRQPRTNRRGRAYIVSVGVSAYENEAFDLSFAANDAEKFEERLTADLMRTKLYEDVISIPLLSDYQIDNPGYSQTNKVLRIKQKIKPRVLTATTATKDNFKNVLRLLSGLPVRDDARNSVPKANTIGVVTPDDIVFIFFSGHGDVEKRTGRFYLIPFDTGPGQGQILSEEVQAHAISSDELAEWVAPIDAGEIVLIVDSCYAAATVDREGFKAGPFGDRGLSQLAYDKGIKVLAATQKDDRASESEILQQGVLTYGLVIDGLSEMRADFRPHDGRILLDEWLSFVQWRVPSLYRDIGAPAVHQPTLFDFERRKRNIVIARSGGRKVAN